MSFIHQGAIHKPDVVVSDCPDGSYSIPQDIGSKYNCVILTTNLTYFAQAEQACSYVRGHLIPIPNGYVNTFLAGLISDSGSDSNFFFGMTNMVGEIWKNVNDGSNMTFSNWITGSTPMGNYPLCAYLQGNGGWGSVHCHYQLAYMCGVPDS
ncbi:hypothetical protein FO519_001227 [Halicephalobus sp. NKZ332]|nr:hypothetical protein FO519_001227 [Halicephalobus sp. NKZ332]